MTEYLRKQLRLGKYTSWAANLNDDQLQAVLWLLGEFLCRQDPSARMALPKVYPGERRRVRAFNALLAFWRRPFSLDTARGLVTGRVV